MILYFRPKRLKNHTLRRGTYLCSLYKGVPPPPPPARAGTTYVYMYTGKLLASKIFFKKNFWQEYPPPLRQNTRLVRQNLTWLGNKTLAKLAGWENKISASLAENTENVCWIWLDRYTFSPGNGSVIFFSGIVEQIWPVYRPPPPQPPLSKNRRRGPLYDFY